MWSPCCLEHRGWHAKPPAISPRHQTGWVWEGTRPFPVGYGAKPHDFPKKRGGAERLPVIFSRKNKRLSIGTHACTNVRAQIFPDIPRCSQMFPDIPRYHPGVLYSLAAQPPIRGNLHARPSKTDRTPMTDKTKQATEEKRKKKCPTAGTSKV